MSVSLSGYIDKQSYTVAAASLTGHASNVTGASWTIATAGADDGLAHFVTVRNDSATDHSAKTILLTGSDANGNAQTETIAAPGTSATVTSTKPFKTLTAAAPSATIGADTFDIGWTAAAVSPWVPVYQHQPNFAVSVALTKTGTINYDVQHTYDTDLSSATAFNHSGMTGGTANDDGQYVAPIVATRVNVNSHTSGVFTFYVMQTER
jgi:hypothetical protein